MASIAQISASAVQPCAMLVAEKEAATGRLHFDIAKTSETPRPHDFNQCARRD
jgi:hypothetical protein